MKQIFTMDVEKDIDAAVRFAEILRKNGKVGEFYICGYLVKRYPEKVKKIAKDHILGGHGYYHEDFAKLSNKVAKAVIRKTIDIFQKHKLNIQGWRFPYMSYSNYAMNQVVKQGLFDSSIRDVVWHRWGRLCFIRNCVRNIFRGIIIFPHIYSKDLRELPWSFADLSDREAQNKLGRIILHCYKY